jgi:hypothetical protein
MVILTLHVHVFEAMKIPDMKSPLSVDSIKVTRQDVVSISYLLDLALLSHAVNTSDWYDA